VRGHTHIIELILQLHIPTSYVDTLIFGAVQMMTKILRASSILIHNAAINRITVTFQPLEELQVVQRSAFNKPANFDMLQNDSHVKPRATIYKHKLLVAHSSASFLISRYLKYIYVKKKSQISA